MFRFWSGVGFLFLLLLFFFLSFCKLVFFLVHFEGSRPEWGISSMMYSRDTPFWLETLEILLARFPPSVFEIMDTVCKDVNSPPPPPPPTHSPPPGTSISSGLSEDFLEGSCLSFIFFSVFMSFCYLLFFFLSIHLYVSLKPSCLSIPESVERCSFSKFSQSLVKILAQTVSQTFVTGVIAHDIEP